MEPSLKSSSGKDEGMIRLSKIKEQASGVFLRILPALMKVDTVPASCSG